MILDEDKSENIFSYVGSVIFCKRKNINFSREKFVKELMNKTGHKISVYNLALIENGQTNPTLKTLTQIADGLKINIVELFPKNIDKS